MTPLLTPDFTQVEAGFPVYEKGRYRVKVTKMTPFIRSSKPDADGNVTTQVGVRYGLEMQGQFDREGNLDDDLQGKSVQPFTCWLHSEGGWKFSKPFLMAAAGYSVKDEQLANEELFQNHNWEIDGEPGADAENIIVGDGYDLPRRS